MKHARMTVAAVVVGLWAVALPAAGQIYPGAGQKLAKVGADGKIERFDGLVEMQAIVKSDKVPAETREAIKPHIRNWLLDLQQQVIDNVDFMVEIEPLDGKPGFFDTFDPANPKHIERIGAFSRQLMSAGPLINLLEFRRALDAGQVAWLRQLTYEYDFAVLQEVMNESKDHMVQMRHQYKTGYRDVLCLYHRLLDKAAPVIDEAVAAVKLNPDQAAAVEKAVAAVKASKDPKAARSAVMAVMQPMTYAQRRAMLLKVRDLHPIDDPYAVL